MKKLIVLVVLLIVVVLVGCGGGGGTAITNTGDQTTKQLSGNGLDMPPAPPY